TRDPYPRRLPPRPDPLARQRLDHPRLRGRARTHARRATPQALAAARRRRNAPLLRLRGDGRRANTRCRRTGGLGGAGAGTVPRELYRDGRRDAAAARRCRDRPPARGVRARESGVRAPLRARQPPRLGGNPGGGYRAAHASGRGSAVTVDLGANPHGVLGAHEAEDGVVVRTLRPEAQAVRIQPAGVEAELKDPAGLWEAL